MDDKIYTYWVTTVSGFEEVAVDELEEKLPGVKVLRLARKGRHGRVFFDYRRSPRPLADLGAPLGVFAHLADIERISPGQPGLERLVAGVEAAPVAAGLKARLACGQEASPGIRLSVRLQGRQRFSRASAQEAVGRALQARHGLQKAPDGAHLVLQVEGRKALFGLQLTPSKRAYIGGPGKEIQGPVAYCLGRLLQLNEDDLVVLPDCLPAAMEPLLQAVATRCIVAASERPQGLKETGAGWPLAAVQELPLRSACADAVLASVAADPEGFAASAARLAEFGRILQPGGVAVVLTPAPREVVALIQGLDLPLRPIARIPIGLRGRKLVVLFCERLEEVRQDDLLEIDL